MNFKQLRGKRLIIFIIVNELVAISLAGICLMSLPSFYEQAAQGKVLLFLGVSVFFSVLVSLIAKVFILPFMAKLKNKASLVFLALFSSLLIIGIGLGSANLWAVPEIHQVEICFTADDESQSLSIEKIMDPNTKRLFPPISFGDNRYPINVESGTCINGRIMKLISRLTESLMGDQLQIDVQENPPSGRFYISVNKTPAVITFSQDEEEQQSASILITEGFDRAERINTPWGQSWFNILKFICIIFSASFLSLFLFGLTEHIQTFQENERFPPNGAVNAEE